MESAYFTPDIEDIHIGYECEINSEFETRGFEWTKLSLIGNSIKTIIEDPEKMKRIRVPYLTKEQIEAEGWKFDYNLGDFDYYVKTVNDTEYELEFCYKERININIWKRTLYHGECKDINTFRKIIKLLEI